MRSSTASRVTRVLQGGRHRQRGCGRLHRRLPRRLRGHLPLRKNFRGGTAAHRRHTAELLRRHPIRPARASAFRISPRRCRHMWRTTATASCANMSVTASAERCTRAPEVPNYGAPGRGPRLLRGMTIAVEPMVNAGGAAVRVRCRTAGLSRPKTVRLPAHYENTILITDGEAGASDGFPSICRT